MYTCGPTMYGTAHIGNLRAYIVSNTVARALISAGYRVRQVVNITDFGHLLSEGDTGEDKMTKGLKREGLALSLENMRALAEKYTAIFLQDLEEVGIDIDKITFPRASDYVPEQIAFIKTLEQKGYAYRTKSGVYFDTSRPIHYGKLGGINKNDQQESPRLKSREEKRNPSDFVLWKPDNHLGWQSPWGLGFPGWHIECSAMSRALLGQEIDIHMGGQDLIPIHHNNEIAQSEAASGRTFVHYWMHNAFLTMGGEKASKSLGNVVYMSDVIEKGFHPLALRYFFLQAHYRTPLSFSFDALASAASALDRLWKTSKEIKEESGGKGEMSEATTRFLATIRDDLATPQAIGILWDSLKSEEYTPEQKWRLIEEADAHLGLSLISPPTNELTETDIPEEVKKMLDAREIARKSKDFKEADRIRDEIASCGYRVEDGLDGPMLTRRL